MNYRLLLLLLLIIEFSCAHNVRQLESSTDQARPERSILPDEAEDTELSEEAFPDASGETEADLPGLSRDFILMPESEGEIISHTWFTLSYSEENEQAEWVYYRLTEGMLTGKSSRTDNFRSDPFVLTGSASPDDYARSGYDRGHLCPAGDMAFDRTAMSETFYMSNMSPQVPAFNRGIWKQLEGFVRYWAVTEQEIHVVTGPIFEDNHGKFASGVTVPGFFYKVIFDPTDEQKMIGFILPNKKGEKHIREYAVSVDSVERFTGIDFFAGLPDDVEDLLETQIDCNLWVFQQYNAPVAGGERLVRCKGIAASKGKRCKNKTKNENGYCHLHQSMAQADGNVEDPNP